MVNFTLNDEKLKDELLLVYKLFFENNDDNCDNISLLYDTKATNLVVNIDMKIQQKNYDFSYNFDISTHHEYKHIKRFCKLALYKSLVNITGKNLPWGSLTGIRPTKLLYELYDEYGNLYKARSILINTFLVSQKKADIAVKVIEQQKGIMKNDNLVDLYVNIPFCTTRCSYCSFISAPLSKCQEYVKPYVDKLIYEIEMMKKLIAKKNYIVRTIYVGGGTPTAIPANELDRILDSLSYDADEFTVEAGRPDTITKEKLDILKKHHVTRISINPQTFCEKTLQKIGRSHTVQEVFDAYKLARQYPFDINMDLIAGLEGESLATFKKSLEYTLALNPENITVHTLSIKRASILIDNPTTKSKSSVVEKMVDYAYKTLTENGYNPYYLYRQKNMLGNLENIGYTRPGHRCVANITSMEEFSSVIAVGANAISKRHYCINDKIVRSPNVKNLPDYINRIDEMIQRKCKLFGLNSKELN